MNIGVFETFCAYLYRKRWLLTVNFLIVSIAVAAYSFVILKKERSASVS